MNNKSITDSYEKEMEEQRAKAKVSGKYSRNCIFWYPTIRLVPWTSIEYAYHLGACRIHEKMLCHRVDASDCPDHFLDENQKLKDGDKLWAGDIEIDVSPEKVWSYITDIGRGRLKIERLTEGPIKEGFRFNEWRKDKRGLYAKLLGGVVVKSETIVVSYYPNVLFEFERNMPDLNLKAGLTYILGKLPQNKTKLIFRSRMWGKSRKVPWPPDKNFKEFLKEVKQNIESNSGV